MGEPGHVDAVVQRAADGACADLSALLHYPNGRSATLSQPIRSGGTRERVDLFGADVSAWVDDLETLHVQRGGITETRTHDPWTSTLTKRGFTAALDHFLDCLRSGRPPVQSAQDALKSHELAQSILDAAGV